VLERFSLGEVYATYKTTRARMNWSMQSLQALSRLSHSATCIVNFVCLLVASGVLPSTSSSSHFPSMDSSHVVWLRRHAS